MIDVNDHQQVPPHLFFARPRVKVKININIAIQDMGLAYGLFQNIPHTRGICGVANMSP